MLPPKPEYMRFCPGFRLKFCIRLLLLYTCYMPLWFHSMLDVDSVKVKGKVYPRTIHGGPA